MDDTTRSMLSGKVFSASMAAFSVTRVSPRLAPSPMPASTGSRGSVVDRGIHQLAEQLAHFVELTRRLGHQDREHVFARIDEEGRAGRTAPAIAADRAGFDAAAQMRLHR